jgi:hypothetical protein
MPRHAWSQTETIRTQRQGRSAIPVPHGGSGCFGEQPTSLQLVGAVVALMVAVRGLFMAKQERGVDLKVAASAVQLQRWNGVKGELEDLTKGISEVCGGIGEEKLREYQASFASGQRTAYVKFLTAGSGDVLRRKFRGASSGPQFAKRLGTYDQTVRKAFSLGDGRVQLPDDLAISGARSRLSCRECGACTGRCNGAVLYSPASGP